MPASRAHRFALSLDPKKVTQERPCMVCGRIFSNNSLTLVSDGLDTVAVCEHCSDRFGLRRCPSCQRLVVHLYEGLNGFSSCLMCL
jgi:DNA-directed RNA polymerase subunit RPC12/RpoP